MERKDFLKQGLLTLLPFPGSSAVTDGEFTELPIVIPPYLKTGDTVGISSPAGYITAEEIQPAIQQLYSWGLKVKIGSTIGKRDGSFGGTDTERAADFQQLMDDPSVQAILCARGGYGIVRIIDQLDFSRLRMKPKWMIGFSDVTVLHAHLNKKIRVAAIHSKMCNSFPDVWEKAEPMQQETILSIRDALMGKPMNFRIPAHPSNRIGLARGELVGGNCKTIESLAASASDMDTRNKILFLEDTGEYLYSIDRMFWNLKRSGKLENLSGLIIGGFKVKASEDISEEFNRNLYQIVMEKLADCSYPVCFEFPVGHQRNNYAVKCGINAQLIVNNDGVQLGEL